MEITKQIHLDGFKAKRRLRNAEEMYPIVESWLESNQSQKSFCEERGMKLHLLSYWARRYNQEKHEGMNDQQNTSLLPLQIYGGSHQGFFAIDISYPNGTRLRLGQMVSLGMLQSLLRQG